MTPLLYVFEFANENDFLWSPVKSGLEKSKAFSEVKELRGIYKKYEGGGLKFGRLFNFISMPFFLAISILFGRKKLIFARTTPPIIQIFAIIFAKLRGDKAVLWLMDYHPVLGIRTSKNALAKAFWNFFDYFDRKTLGSWDLIIVIDDAMKELVLERCPNARIKLIPTWSKTRPTNANMYRVSEDEISLLYSGNLGVAHNTSLLEEFVSSLAKKTKVKICYCGNLPAAAKRLKSVADRAHAQFEQFERIKNYEEMGKFYESNKFSYGIVLLNDEMKGVVSPSKFSGYAAFGLPLLYFGPKGSNAEISCSKFEAGIAISNMSEIEVGINSVLKADNRDRLAQNTTRAMEYFYGFSAKDVSSELVRIAQKK